MSDDARGADSPRGELGSDRAASLRRALERYLNRLARKRDGLQADLAEANRAAEYRRFGETLLVYAHQVPARADEVALPDPAEPSRTLTIPLDPAIAAPANASRYFKRAAKAERGQREVPPRLEKLEREISALRARLEAAESATDETRDQAQLELERALARLTPTTREQIRAPQPLPGRVLGLTDAEPTAAIKSPTTAAPRASRAERELPGKLQPWRFRTREGWDVLIGRTSEGNDHLTLHMARPEDYWFHAHGCPGSHVVLRRGKGPNEPSKATLEEVASWAAFHSKARTAGKVLVHYTQKKYVRKPRGSKPGLVTIEREKSLLVRPVEPPREQMANAEPLGEEA